MATSSFTKTYSVPAEKAEEFVEEMEKETKSTNTGFKSQLLSSSEVKQMLDKIVNLTNTER